MGAPIFDEVWASILSRRTAAQKVAYMGASGMYGIDCSSWQPSVEWPAVAASGRQFAMIKAAEGNSTSYPTLDAQYHGAIGAGMTVGLYIYGRPELSPIANADALAQQVNRLGATPANGHLPPTLDLEEGSGDMSGWVQAFIARLREQTGSQRVMIYSDASFFSSQIQEHWMDDDVVLWIADFSTAPGHPSYLTPRVAIHQFSQDGQVPGVSDDVDLDYAIWPLDQIITGEVPELTPDEHNMLQDIHDMLPVIQWVYGQLAGPGPDGRPAPYPTVPGWQPFEGGTDKPLSLLDYLRESNVQLNTLTTAVQNAITNSGGASVDAKALADEVVAEFLAKLTPPPAAPSV